MKWSDKFPPLNLYNFPIKFNMHFSKEKIEADRKKALADNKTVTLQDYAHGQVFPSSPIISSPPNGGVLGRIGEGDHIPTTTRSSVLKEANNIVNGARNKQYGSPEDNFQNIADLWNGYLRRAFTQPDGTIAEITPVDVANLMALMKIARLKYSPDHRDSWVDLAGYAACGAEIGLKDKE